MYIEKDDVFIVRFSTAVSANNPTVIVHAGLRNASKTYTKPLKTNSTEYEIVRGPTNIHEFHITNTDSASHQVEVFIEKEGIECHQYIGTLAQDKQVSYSRLYGFYES